jgi:outer membrane protein
VNSIKRTLLTAITCYLLLPLYAQQAPTVWSLQQCIDYALVNNNAVKQADVISRINKNNLLQSKLNLLPSVNAAISNDLTNGLQFNLATFSQVTANTFTLSGNLSADLTLFSGLQQIHAIQRSKYDFEAGRYDIQATQNTMILNITTAFLQIMQNKEVLKVAENQKQLSIQQRERVQKMVQSGAAPEVNLQEMNAQVARDESNIINAKNGVELGLLSLRLLMQLPPEQQFDVVMPVIGDDLGPSPLTENGALSVYNTAVLTQPSIKAADMRIKSAEADKKIAMGSFSPTLSIGANLFTSYNTRNFTYDSLGERIKPLGKQFDEQFRKSGTITLSIPIFSKGQRFTNTANARLQVQLQQLRLEAEKNTLLQNVFQADANARAALESFNSAKISFEASQKAFEALEKRYNAGVSNFYEYQQSKNNVATAESEMVRAKFNYIFRIKVLDFYKGNPITLNN